MHTPGRGHCAALHAIVTVTGSPCIHHAACAPKIGSASTCFTHACSPCVRVRAGTLPFQGEAVILMYDQIREGPLLFPADVPASPALKRLLRAMLAKDPARRLSLDQILADPWMNPAAVPKDPQVRCAVMHLEACSSTAWQLVRCMARDPIAD